MSGWERGIKSALICVGNCDGREGWKEGGFMNLCISLYCIYVYTFMHAFVGLLSSNDVADGKPKIDINLLVSTLAMRSCQLSAVGRSG